MHSPGGALAKGVVATVAAVMVLAAVGCQNDGGGSRAEFEGPNQGELTAGFGGTCDGGDTASPSGRLSLGAQGFDPGSAVSLRWAVIARGINGSWDGVLAEDDGSLHKTVELPKTELRPGDVLEVWAEGRSVDGILAVSTNVPIGSC